MGKKAQKPRALEVEIIYGKRIKNGHTEYWIKWKGFPEKDSTWENVTNIEDKNAGKMIKAFEAKTKADEKAAAKGASDKKKTPAKTAADKKKTPAKAAAEKKKTPAKAAAEKKKTPAKVVAEKKKAPAKVVAEKKKAPAKKTTPPKVVAEKKKAPAKKEAKAASKKRSVRDSDAAQAAKLIKEVLDHWESADASDESEDDSPPPAKRSKKAPKKLDDSPEPAPAKKKRTEKSPAKKAPPAKKQATEKKKTPAKKKEDIFQVESLSEVRKSADGSREYFVKWDKGPATWEPEANIADDLIEEFEEEQMVQASAKAKFKNNMAVEVLNDTDGFEWSWTTAKIVSAGKKADSFNLEYALFEDGKGKPLKEKDVPKKRLRAVAKAAPKGWYPALGDKIEVAEDDCWWESQVTKEEKSKNKVKVMLRVSDEEKFFKIKDARPCAWDTSSTPAKAKRK